METGNKQQEKKVESNQMKNKTYKIRSSVGQIGDFAKEWWTQKDHDRWDKKVKEWKRSGEFGKPFTIEMTLIHNPSLDNESYSWPEFPLSSARMGFLDFSKTSDNE